MNAVHKIQILDSTGKPLKGILGMVTIKMKQKNDYRIILNYSDQQGIIELSEKFLNEAAKREADFAPMDFLSLCDDGVAAIEFSLMEETQLENANTAYKMFKEVVKFPEAYLDNLQNGKVADIMNVNIKTISGDLLFGNRVVICPPKRR